MGQPQASLLAERMETVTAAAMPARAKCQLTAIAEARLERWNGHQTTHDQSGRLPFVASFPIMPEPNRRCACHSHDSAIAIGHQYGVFIVPSSRNL